MKRAYKNKFTAEICPAVAQQLKDSFSLPLNMKRGSQNYTGKIIANSSWASLSFVITSLANFLISVVLTRYLGKENYGIYSYFIWLAAVIGIFGGFGLSQTTTKYLSRFYFEEKTKLDGARLFKKLLLAQGILAVAGCIMLLLIAGPLRLTINFSPNFKEKIFLIAILSIIPLSLNTLCASTLSAMQQFKKLSIVQIFTACANLILIMLFVTLKYDLAGFFWLFLGFNLFLAVNFLIAIRELLINPALTSLNKPREPLKNCSAGDAGLGPSPSKLLSYSLWNYLTVIFSQIAWERSEIFFLGIFSGAGQIAVYSLAYSIATLFIGVFTPLNTVLNYTTAEFVALQKNDKLFSITAHASRYLAILMLPAAIFVAGFINEIIIFFYGKNFAEAGLLFPLLVIGHIIAIIASPAANVPNLKNEARKITLITAATGILNIALDFYLIPRYFALGAAIANAAAQFFYVTLILFNAQKYRIGLLNVQLARIFGINAGLAGAIALISTQFQWIFIKITAATLCAVIYGILTIKFAFNQNDLAILANLGPSLPKPLQPVFNFIFKKIEQITHEEH